MRRAGEFLLGGCVVYVAMAAQAAGGCSGDRQTFPAGLGGEGGYGGAPSGGGEAGAVAMAGEGGSGGILDPVPHADAKSGTRLKALVWRGADGAEQSLFLWRDSGRGETCTFRRAGDGRMRCLPVAFESKGLYVDSNCVAPAVAIPKASGAGGAPACAEPGAADPRYGLVADLTPGACGGARVYAPGVSLPYVYHRSETGACVAFEDAPFSGFTPGNEVPPEAFVEVSVAELP